MSDNYLIFTLVAKFTVRNKNCVFLLSRARLGYGLYQMICGCGKEATKKR
jgi:hypothetical protein